MVEVITLDLIISFLIGVILGFAIGVLIILLKERSEKRLTNYLIDMYADKFEEENLPEPKKSGLNDEEKAKYLRAVLKSIEKHDMQIKKKKRRIFHLRILLAEAFLHKHP